MPKPPALELSAFCPSTSKNVIPLLCLITAEKPHQLSEADVLLWCAAAPRVASIHLSVCVLQLAAADEQGQSITMRKIEVMKMRFGKLFVKQNFALLHFSMGKKKERKIKHATDRNQDISESTDVTDNITDTSWRKSSEF